MGIQEDRKKVPWSDKETVILLEIWGDPQVEDNITMEVLLFSCVILIPLVCLIISLKGLNQAYTDCKSSLAVN